MFVEDSGRDRPFEDRQNSGQNHRTSIIWQLVERGFRILSICLNLYLQKKDEKLGPYSLLTVCVETDKGAIEMTYDEGYRGEKALEEAAAFLTSHLGLSGIILRSVIQLENAMQQT